MRAPQPEPRKFEPDPELQRQLAEALLKLPACNMGESGSAAFATRVEADGTVTLAYPTVSTFRDCEALRCVADTLEKARISTPPREKTYVPISLRWSDARTAEYVPKLAFPTEAVAPTCPRKAGQPTFGRLEPKVIQDEVRRHFGEFRICYEKGLASDPELEGNVDLRFVIDREGKVSNIGLGRLTLPNCAVASCVVGVMRTATFPKPEGGIVTVTYPINFSSK